MCVSKIRSAMKSGRPQVTVGMPTPGPDRAEDESGERTLRLETHGSIPCMRQFALVRAGTERVQIVGNITDQNCLVDDLSGEDD
jgi:hypothetical protein